MQMKIMICERASMPLGKGDALLYGFPDTRCVSSDKEGGKALCKFSDGGEDWVNFSEIDDDSEVFTDGTFGMLIVSPREGERLLELGPHSE
jgi:hypothetical protein